MHPFVSHHCSTCSCPLRGRVRQSNQLRRCEGRKNIQSSKETKVVRKVLWIGIEGAQSDVCVLVQREKQGVLGRECRSAPRCKKTVTGVRV